MPKRAGHLMPLIVDRENLHEAFLRAARGKQGKQAVRQFRAHLDNLLSAMRSELLEGTYRFGTYNTFTVYDPKERLICAAPFRDRVAFHAMMRVCHPVFDNFQVSGSFASRIGLGQYAALKRTQQLCRRYEWFAKMDVRKYFDSIDHGVMLAQLCRLFKDRQLLSYFQDLLATYETLPGKGLPIGNLTSQYFANHYLAVADHRACEVLRVPALVRYMDDILFFANDKARLKRLVGDHHDMLAGQLRLQMHPAVVNRTRFGVPFLGYVAYGDCLRLNERSRRRYCRKMGELDQWLARGQLSDREYAMRATCLLAFVKKADTAGLRRLLFGKQGNTLEGAAPTA